MTPTTPTRRRLVNASSSSSSGSQQRGKKSFGKGVGEDNDEMLDPMEGTRGGFGWRQGGGGEEGGGGRRRTALFAGACVAASLLAVSTGRGMRRDSLHTPRTLTTTTTRGVLGSSSSSSSASQFLADAWDASKTNLVLCKIPKLGGTTLAGVWRRIRKSRFERHRSGTGSRTNRACGWITWPCKMD